jgi:hypothetical protein
MNEPKAIFVRVRSISAPYGTGVTHKFSGDDLDALDPLYETALDKLADGIIRMMYAGYDESLI